MKLWFLRIKDDDFTRTKIQRLKLAPILFRKIPAAECRLNMAEAEVQRLVDRYYSNDSNRTRGHYRGSLQRFLSEAMPGDLVAIKVNKEDLLYAEILSGTIVEVRGHHQAKGRPIRELTRGEVQTLRKNRLRTSVLKYRGTMCLWSQEIDLPDSSEIKVEGLAPVASEGNQNERVIKFIRVGADGGAGGRLSRLFPGRYYHFIPIPKHNDPEFCCFTYGSGCSAIRDFSLLHMRKGDVLVFYAGFRADTDGVGQPIVDCRDRVGIFAYYVLEKAFLVDYNFRKNGRVGHAVQYSELPRGVKLLNSDFLPTAEFSRLATHELLGEILDDYKDYNPHIDEAASDSAILICGAKPPQSRLLSKVEFLASLENGAYIIAPARADKWGLKHNADLTRCSVRTVNRATTEAVFKRLTELP